MPLNIPNYPDPTSVDLIPETYVYCASLELYFSQKVGRIVFYVHRDIESAYAGKQPVGIITYDINPFGRSEVKDGDGNVLVPAFPSFDELMSNNLAIFGPASQLIYQLAMTQNEFKDAKIIGG